MDTDSIACLIGGAIKKIPAIPTLLTGSATAIVLAFIHQPGLTIQGVANILMNGYVAQTADPKINEFISRGGIMSMLSSASLILLAIASEGLLIKYTIVRQSPSYKDRSSVALDWFYSFKLYRDQSYRR